jgi:hypothetical protein
VVVEIVIVLCSGGGGGGKSRRQSLMGTVVIDIDIVVRIISCIQRRRLSEGGWKSHVRAVAERLIMLDGSAGRDDAADAASKQEPNNGGAPLPTLDGPPVAAAEAMAPVARPRPGPPWWERDDGDGDACCSLLLPTLLLTCSQSRRKDAMEPPTEASSNCSIRQRWDCRASPS